jgi:hypothetical protein
MTNFQTDMRRTGIVLLAAVLTLAACQPGIVTPTQEATQQAKATAPVTEEATRQVKATAPVTQQAASKASPMPNQQPNPAIEAMAVVPYPDAPLCPDSGDAHDNSLFHTLWDGDRGCHYDHEHGQNPFTPEVAAAFPGLDLRALLGGVGVGHTNPSSPMENTHKHGGFKWDVALVHPENCTGFEGSEFGVNASVIQYHAFGDEAIELEARVHSTVALVRECSSANPTDYGYVYVVQFQNYGQRIVPYQGTVVAYPDQPVPAYDSARGPYLSVDCVGPVIQCRTSLQDVLTHHQDVNSSWASKPTGKENLSNPFGSKLFTLLFRLRDGYRLFDWNDQTYPFTFLWLCSADGGMTYNPVGCRYNNSTTQLQEIAGSVPAEWDNLAGFDTDLRVGRITAEGFVTQYGDLAPDCSPSAECFPIKMVHAFVGNWGSVLVYSSPGKGTNIVPAMPSRNIYFCGGKVCAESDPGATPSGWIGQNN